MIRTIAHNFKDKLINLCGNEHQRANTQGRAPPPFSAWCISPDLTPKRFFSKLQCIAMMSGTCLMCVRILILSYNAMVEHLSSRRPALPGHSGASLTQLEILGSCVISLESEMGKIFSTWLFQTAPDKVWQHLEVVWWTFQQMKERNNKDKLMCLLKGRWDGMGWDSSIKRTLHPFFKFKALQGIIQEKKFYRPTLNCKIPPPKNFLGHPISQGVS